jgi:hypothetical protein
MQAQLGQRKTKTDFLSSKSSAGILSKMSSRTSSSGRVEITSQRASQIESKREAKIADIIDQQTQLILTSCALFFQGLIKPRPQMNFININCKSINAGLIKSPYLTHKLASYILHMVLPFSKFTLTNNILSRSEQAYVNDEINQRAIMDRFAAMCKDVKLALSQCKVTHPLAYQTDIRDEDGNVVYDFHLMERAAAKEILITIALLKSKCRMIPESIFFDDKLNQLRPDRDIEYDLNNEINQLLHRYSVNICLHTTNPLQDRIMAGLLWFVSAFSDWCNYDTVVESDIIAAIRMMLPNESDFAAVMNVLFVRVNVDDKFREKIYDQCIEHNLYPSDVSLSMILSFITFMSNEDTVTIGIRNRALAMINNFIQPQE